MFHFQYIAADVQKVRNYLREEEMAEVQTKHVTSTETLQNGDESPSPFAECDTRTRRSETAVGVFTEQWERQYYERSPR
jgi:hypothetical protein